ncbi:unnamed protein product [Colias eurytheme]|nr:unnamed protein product [Colias eurytheme]
MHLHTVGCMWMVLVSVVRCVVYLVRLRAAGIPAGTNHQEGSGVHIRCERAPHTTIHAAPLPVPTTTLQFTIRTRDNYAVSMSTQCHGSLALIDPNMDNCDANCLPTRRYTTFRLQARISDRPR